MKPTKILMPIPNFDCDPTEVAIPWKLMTEAGFEVIFTTPNGKKGQTDEIMLTGKGLGLLKSVLAARFDAKDAFGEMSITSAFCNPLKYDEVQENDFDGLILPGGHDKGVKDYLESKILQDIVVDFFRAQKPVGAICHGVVLAARSIDSKTGHSVLYDYNTTCLLKSQEMMGFNLTRLWMGDYYLTYPGLTVEDEVKKVLSDPKQFFKGPLPMLRDDKAHLGRGFVVQDRNYISARWPGDVYNFGLKFIQLILK